MNTPMTKNEFSDFCNQYCFKEYAQIIIKNGHPTFQSSQIQSSSNTYGHVYIWIEIEDECTTVIYVGMAGKTIKDRCTQHEAGFKKSTTGLNHSSRIISGISSEKKYKVYVRESYKIKIFEEENISMCSVEEIAFIKKLHPLWNRSSKLQIN